MRFITLALALAVIAAGLALAGNYVASAIILGVALALPVLGLIIILTLAAFLAWQEGEPAPPDWARRGEDDDPFNPWESPP